MSPWSRSTIVAAWEFRRRIQTRGFWLSTLLVPLVPLFFGVVGIILIPLLQSSDSSRTDIALYDATGRLQPNHLPEGVRFSSDSTTWRAWQKELQQGTLRWLIIVTDSSFQQRRVTVLGRQGALSKHLRQELEHFLLSSYALSTRLDSVTTSLLLHGLQWEMQWLHPQKSHAQTALGIAASAIVAALLLSMLASYGSILTDSIVEEKELRIAELLLGAARPIELLWGKVIGLGAVGLFQLLCWIVFVGVLSSLIALPTITAILQLGLLESAKEFQAIADTTLQTARHALLLILACFVMGYLLYAGIFASVGALATDRTQAAPFQAFIIFPLAFPFFLLHFLLEAPESFPSLFLTVFPLTAPVALPLRALAGGINTWEVAASVGCTLALTVLLLWIAGKLYRVGMLHYSGLPTPRQLWQWLRQVG